LTLRPPRGMLKVLSVKWYVPAVPVFTAVQPQHPAYQGLILRQGTELT
jgi:hypothetical protein